LIPSARVDDDTAGESTRALAALAFLGPALSVRRNGCFAIPLSALLRRRGAIAYQGPTILGACERGPLEGWLSL
jgi:hypothetical protein